MMNNVDGNITSNKSLSNSGNLARSAARLAAFSSFLFLCLGETLDKEGVE